MSIFDKRELYRPFEYPEVIKIGDLLTNTFWTDKEVTFTSDVMEFNNLSDSEKEAILRTVTLISTVEVKVKNMWCDIGEYFPKPEIYEVGIIAGESEVRHARSYAKLLDKLGQDEYFEKALQNPFIKGRFDYLEKYLKLGNQAGREKYILKIVLFSLLIENVSLFSQFATMAYFYRHKGIMKDVRNIIKWSAVDELTHLKLGAFLINTVRKEFPEIFTDEFNAEVVKVCKKSLRYESELLDWVFENGELPNMNKVELLRFMEWNLDKGLQLMGFSPIYNVELPKNLMFFVEEVFADNHDDFFAVRVTDYNLKDKSFTGNDLF